MTKKTGKKFDQGKPLPTAVIDAMPNALLAVIDAGTYGVEKYGERDNWKEVENATQRYKDAALRHHFERAQAEDDLAIDNESQCYHLAQEIWSLLATLELSLTGVDR